MSFRKFLWTVLALSSVVAPSARAVDVIVGSDLRTSPAANRLFRVVSDGTAVGTSANLSFITLSGVAPNPSSAAQGVTYDAANQRIVATVGSTQIAKFDLSGTQDGAVVTQTFSPAGSTSFRNLRMNAAGTQVLSTQIASQRIVTVNPTTLATGTPTYASGANTTSVFQPTAGGFVYGLTQTGLTRFNEDGTGATTITLSGFAPATTGLRDIFFTDANTFYLSNYAGSGSGGGVWKFNLSGTTATVDNSWGSSGRAAWSNAFGLALSGDGTYLYSSSNFTSTNTGSLAKILLSNGAVTTLINGAAANFGYITVVPEPSTYALVALATCVLGATAKRRRKTS